VTHISLFCAKNVNINGQFCNGYYNASYSFFLRSFIKGFFTSIPSRKIIRSIEKAIGDFNLNTLNLEYQNPFYAQKNLIHKVDGHPYTLDLSSFVNQLSNDEEDFDDYLLHSQLIDIFGSKKEEINEKELSAANLKAKSR